MADSAASRTKVLIVITGLAHGGAELMLQKVVQRLNFEEFHVNVLSLTSVGDIGRSISSRGVSVEELGLKRGQVSFLALFRLIRRFRALRPDVVQTWMYHADLMGGVAARLAGIRAIGWGIRHSNLDPALNKPLTLRVVKLCSMLSHWVPRRILVCSEAARRVHVQAGYAADKMVVVPNGFDLTRFQPSASARAALRAECGLNDDTPLVGIAARFDPQKNIRGFLEAATLLTRKLPQVHFLLAGAGLDSGNSVLVADIARLGLASQVHLLGARDDMPLVMATLDVLASSSHGEAFPNVLGEAMACGVPCAVTDAGDSAMIVGDTGRVVSVADMPALADAMFGLLAMPRLDRIALGERARQRVQEHFEIGHVVRQYEAFYRSLVQADTLCAV